MGSLSADSVVYFPLINLPPTTWSAQAVLYWDRIFVPVPEQAAEAFDELHDEPTMRELLQSRLVERVRPTDHLSRLERLEDVFLATLRTVPDFDERREQFGQDSPFFLHEGKASSTVFERGPEGDGSFSLHTGKATSGLLTGLRDLGLGAPAEDEWGWWYVERSTGYEYMAVLAAELANAVGAVPTTDKREFLEPFGEPARAVQQEAEILLGAALPVPESIDVRKILRFKERHHDELIRFRKRVEELAQLVAWAPPEMRDEQRLQAAREVLEARREVEARFLQSRFDALVLHRLMAIPSLAFPVVSTVRDVVELLRPAPREQRSALAYGAWVDRTLS